MSFLKQLAERQAAARTNRGNTAVAQGNIAVRLTGVDRKHPSYGWMMKGEIVGGTRGVGTEINFVVSKEALEKIKESSLAPKVKEGAVLRLQDVNAPQGSGTPEKPVTVRRMTGLNLDGRGKTFYGAAFRITMFKSGAYQVTTAEMETKARIDSIAALKERVMADLSEGKVTAFIGGVEGHVITSEAYRGQVRNENGDMVPEDLEVSWNRFSERLFEGADLNDPEQVAEIDADLAANEQGFNAYSAVTTNIIGKTKKVMEEKLLEGGRPNSIPIDAMFPRSIADRFSAATNRMEDREVEVLSAEFAAWAETKLSTEERAAYEAGGFSEVSESNLAKFLVQSGVELPNRATGQAVSWLAAKERLDTTPANRVSTGWCLGDVTIDNHVDSGNDTLDYFYVRTMNVYNSNNAATPYFPDPAAREANQTYVYGLTDRLKEFVKDPEAHKKAAAEAAAARKAARNPAPAQDATAPQAENPEAAAENDDANLATDMAADPEPVGTVSDEEIGDAIAGNLEGFDLQD